MAQTRILKGQTAIVTGGGTGVGKAIALALAEEQVHVCLIGRRTAPLEEVAASARRLGATGYCYAADLASESDQLELARRLVAAFPEVDVLVHSAAICESGPVGHAALEDFDKHYRTNVRAAFALTQALLPALKAARGQVVFINSSGGITAKPMLALYASSKHALKAIADSLRGEVNTHGVRVLSVYLGRTATEMQARIHQAEGVPYRPELLLQPEDVAAIILSCLKLPGTAEVTDIHIRPAIAHDKAAAVNKRPAELNTTG